MEHTVYLAAKAFVQEISPKQPSSVRSTHKGTVTVEDVEDKEEDEAEEDGLDWTADWTYLESIPDGEEVDEVLHVFQEMCLGRFWHWLTRFSFFFFLFPILIFSSFRFVFHLRQNHTLA